MYTIIHVDKSWIVCAAQGKLFIFDRKPLALKTVHDAKELMRANEENGCVIKSAVNGRAAASPATPIAGSPGAETTVPALGRHALANWAKC